MSDLNVMYNTGSSASQQMWSSVGRNSADSVWSRMSVGTESSRRNEDDNLNSSIFKSYLDSLRTRSDEQAQKILKSLENSPADTISKLFGSLQTNSSENVGKLFDGLKLDSAEDMKTLMDRLRMGDTAKTAGLIKADDAENADKTEKSAAAKADEAKKTDKTASAVKADEAKKADKTDETDKTDKAAKTDDEETLFEKYLHKISEKMSAENNALYQDTDAMQNAVKRAQDAFEPDEKTGEIDADKAYSAAEDFVKSYNSFADAIKNSKNGAVTGKAAFIEDMVGAYSRRLEKVGIEQDENGRLSVDREELEASSSADREKVFGQKSSVAEFIDGQAKQLQAYAQTDLYQRSGSYNDGGSIIQISNITGAYFNMLG
ncbi:MAG: hypothetical protein IJT87_06645 [Ruminiclostridium sp.]|nr:hypothetical protein [Ruminiclostridium sp.]